MLRNLSSQERLTEAFGPVISAASTSFPVDLDDDAVQTALDLRSRRFSNDQLRALEHHASQIFASLGLDLQTPGTHDTPRRFIRALIDATAGYDGDPKLLTAFPTECHGGSECCRLNQIIEGPIQFFSLCEHHALPFYGQAYIGYIAHHSIIGISKLTRLARVFAQRFSVQERIGLQIVETLDAMLQPRGVGVYLQAHHMCTQMRGVRGSEPLTRTTFWRGEYERSAELRAEFLDACSTALK
jgi:GTP cyclohydrolase IA